ncbi:hypothetical protein [Runella zeae]|uniref:hypothetical protein n=1 Tax=Runella zeae TaxID=94255 RepID=UPI0004148022|nr:hypothetical protein [Runella zeae]
MAVTNIAAIQNYQSAYTPKILKTLYDSLSIPKTPGIRTMNNLTVEKPLWGYSAEDGLQPNNPQIEDTDRQDGTLLIRSITPKKAMKILKINAEEFEDTFLYEGQADLTQEHPPLFAATYWQNQMQKVAQEVEVNAYLMKDKSVAVNFNAGTAYTAGQVVIFGTLAQYYQCVTNTSAGETPVTHPAKWKWASNKYICDGWGTVLATEIAGSKITPVVTGAITNANALDKIDGTMWAAVPELMRQKGVKFYVSWNVYDKRLAHMRAKKDAGATYSETELALYKDYIIDSSRRAQIIPCNWMGASQRVIVTLDNNLVMGTNSLDNLGVWGNRVPMLHGYKTIMKFTLAFQFDDLRYLIVNDQA